MRCPSLWPEYGLDPWSLRPALSGEAHCPCLSLWPRPPAVFMLSCVLTEHSAAYGWMKNKYLKFLHTENDHTDTKHYTLRTHAHTLTDVSTAVFTADVTSDGRLIPDYTEWRRKCSSLYIVTETKDAVFRRLPNTPPTHNWHSISCWQVCQKLNCRVNFSSPDKCFLIS